MSSYLNKNLKINKKPTNTVELDSLVLEEINTINNNNNVVKRPGREIKVDNEIIGYDNVTVKIGTVENRNEPNTVFITMGFWVDIKKSVLRNNSELINFDNVISKKYNFYLKNLYKKELKNLLEDNKYFPYIYEFPENINYNFNKRCYTFLELNLHTLNSISKINKKYPLKNKLNSEIYDECLKVVKTILQNDLFKNKLEFRIYKKKK